MSFIWDKEAEGWSEEDGEGEELSSAQPHPRSNSSSQHSSRNKQNSTVSSSKRTADSKSEPSEHNLSYEEEDGEGGDNDSIDEISVPIVTNELEPSVCSKISRLIRGIILFPTKVTAILGFLSLFWLTCCASWITYGLTNDHYCPADPRIPQIIAWHGILWVIMSAYIIVRLVWVEINPSRTPTCTWRVGNPVVSIKWKKELTYVFDVLLWSAVFICYMVQFVLLVKLTRNDQVLFYSSTSSDWPRCSNCCLKSVVAFGSSELFLSYIAMTTTVTFYLYAMGWLESIRRRLCLCDIGQTSEESTPLV